MLADLVKRSQPLAADTKLLVLGGGYSGRCLAGLARALGTPVLCTRRSLDSAEADLLFDSNGQDQLDPAALEGVTHLLSTIPPDREGNDPVLLKLLPTLRSLPLRWAGYLWTAACAASTANKLGCAQVCRSRFCVCQAFMDRAGQCSTACSKGGPA